MQLQMPSRNVKPPAIEVGDRVEVKVPGACYKIGVVRAVEYGVYKVFVRGYPLVRTRSVSYQPDVKTLAKRCAAVREARETHAVNNGDFYGFDGPGIRETRLVVGPKGSNRGV